MTVYDLYPLFPNKKNQPVTMHVASFYNTGDRKTNIIHIKTYMWWS